MQIVGYETANPTDSRPASLLVARDGKVERTRLDQGTELAYRLGERRCAGRLDGPRHVPCSSESAPFCDSHTDRWACARCTGECDLPLESCREEHAIYLAAFAPDTFKVGVTRSWRLEERLREQGADRAAHIQTVENGRTARQVEVDIATDVGDRVRIPTKIRGLHETVDQVAWNALLDRFDPLESFQFDYGLDLLERPMAETIASGTVRGTQGRVLLLIVNGGTYAVNLRDLVGHQVTEGDPDRALQSSFSAFE